MTDLVFIDPVSTGYSRAAAGEDAKQFHGVEEDVKSIAHFIRLFTTLNLRWDSPKYLAGESYGTTRAAALAGHLHDKHFLNLNGIMLISSVLNFQTISDPQGGNDLPYIVFLPSYTAAAWYHNKLDSELQKDFHKALEEAQTFAETEYTLALMQGNALNPKKRQEIVLKLARYTGLTPDYIEGANLRVDNIRFAKELLRKEHRTIGRFDSRYKGIDSDSNGSSFEYDPSLDSIAGAFTATFNQYVRAGLKWETDTEYQVLTSLGPWDYSKSPNQYLYVGETLRSVMSKNPNLKVFVGSGYYDLATPYFATDYTFRHLGLDASLLPNITMKYYDGGHMMYVQYPELVQLKRDLAEFLKK